MISIIVPAFNIANNLDKLHRRLVLVSESLNEPYEIIIIDSGSTDGTRQKLIKLSPITAVLLSRNFGRNAAYDAGFKMAVGDFVVTFSGDMENNPEDIKKIVDKLREGYGVVSGWRQNRQDVFYRKLFSRFANWLVSKISGVKLRDFHSSLKGYRREFIDGVQILGETFIFMPIFAHDSGARVAEIEISSANGEAQKSRRKISEMAELFFDLISVKFLLNYFSQPLRFFGKWSLFSLFLAASTFIWAIIMKILGINDFSTTPLPVISTMFVVLSVTLFMMGFITEILLRIYYDRKDNAPYMIYEVVKNKK